MIGDILLVYAITQLVSNAYGITVIGTVKRFVKDELKNRGYEQRNMGSMYKFNEGLGNFFKLFIPFYYTVKAMNLIEGNNAINRAADESIVSGEYVTHEENMNFYAQEEVKKNQSHVQVMNESKIMFEKPNKYTARKNDYDVLYNTNENPVEYIEREAPLENNFTLTPFEESRVSKNDSTHENNEVDVISAISSLDSSKLVELSEKIIDLAEIKERNKKLMLEKDVA